MTRKFLTGIDLGGSRITTVGDATNPTDAVTLQQVQAFVRGLKWKDSVRAASTGNISLATPGATMDGVTLAANDRILLKNQTTGSENGIYVWTGASAALTRSLDATSAGQLSGASVLVTEGTLNADKQFNQTADAITVGTTSLTWVQFGGGGTTYSAGNGLSLGGTTFTAVAGNGIVVDGTGIRLDTSVAVRKFAQTVGDGTATTIAVTHGLGSTDVQTLLFLVSTGERVEADIVNTSSTVVTLSFATAPASNSIRVTVQG